MLGLENPEEILLILDRYTALKQKDIPKELDEYLSFVARTGDPVYNWSTIQYLFREKLTSVIREFHDTTPSIEGRHLVHCQQQIIDTCIYSSESDTVVWIDTNQTVM